MEVGGGEGIKERQDEEGDWEGDIPKIIPVSGRRRLPHVSKGGRQEYQD